jgi:nucleoid-associated protein YgaU
MKKPTLRLILLSAPCAVLLAGTSGCVTLDNDANQMQAREDMLIVQDNMQKLSGRIEGLELEVERLRRDVDAARSGPSPVQPLQARLDDLEARIRAVDAARERDKQEIVDKLSTKITQIVSSSKSSGSSSVKKQGSKKSSSSSSQTGYEHEVQAGDTLSAIAAAYGVSTKVILDNNDVKDPNRLRVGQKLFIPE